MCANPCIDQSRMSEPAMSSWLTLTTTNKILYSLRENKLFLSTLNGVRGCIKNIFEFNYFQKYWIKNVFVIVFKKILSMQAGNYLSACLDLYMKNVFGFNVYFSMQMLHFPPCFSISLYRNIEWGPGKKVASNKVAKYSPGTTRSSST